MNALPAFALLAASLAAGPAVAHVFEISDDGTMLVRAAGGIVTVSAAAQGESPDDLPDGDAAAPDLPPAAVTTVDFPEAPDRFRAPLLDAAHRYQVSPSLLAALVWHESRWQPTALSSKGAIGLAQLMPATARALAVDPHDAGANLAGAAHYLRQMLDLFDGDVERALAAYDAGPARVLKAGGIPAIAETRSYVSAIVDRLSRTNAVSSTGVSR